MATYNAINPVQSKGWECPKCGSVWAPFMPECSYCNDAIQQRRASSGTTENADLTGKAVDAMNAKEAMSRASKYNR